MITLTRGYWDGITIGVDSSFGALGTLLRLSSGGLTPTLTALSFRAHMAGERTPLGARGRGCRGQGMVLGRNLHRGMCLVMRCPTMECLLVQDTPHRQANQPFSRLGGRLAPAAGQPLRNPRTQGPVQAQNQPAGPSIDAIGRQRIACGSSGRFACQRDVDRVSCVWARTVTR